MRRLSKDPQEETTSAPLDTMKTSYTPTLSAVLRETIRGKSVGRTLTNLFWRGRVVLSGQVLDIGGGSQGSHYRFLEEDERLSLKVAHIVPLTGTAFSLYIGTDKMPLPDDSNTTVPVCNFL